MMNESSAAQEHIEMVRNFRAFRDLARLVYGEIEHIDRDWAALPLDQVAAMQGEKRTWDRIRSYLERFNPDLRQHVLEGEEPEADDGPDGPTVDNRTAAAISFR